jgi:hypothetical protein
MSSKNHTLSLGMKIGGAKNRMRDRRLNTYQEDTRRWPPKRSFFGGGSVPPGLDEDTPTIAAMVAAAAVKLDGTNEIPNRWVSSINTGKMLIPF